MGDRTRSGTKERKAEAVTAAAAVNVCGFDGSDPLSAATSQLHIPRADFFHFLPICCDPASRRVSGTSMGTGTTPAWRHP